MIRCSLPSLIVMQVLVVLLSCHSVAWAQANRRISQGATVRRFQGHTDRVIVLGTTPSVGYHDQASQSANDGMVTPADRLITRFSGFSTRLAANRLQ